jgi:membrane associated rhomboid family serine protease
MGIMENNSKNRLLLGQQGNALVALIAVNFIVFVTLIFLKIAFSLSSNINFESVVLKWFTLPSQLNELAYKPWTVFTYMFSHIEVWHLFGNMVWLYTFGYILQDLAGNKKLGPVYIYGGLAGALVFILSYNLFPGFKAALANNAILMGGSAGVMAIALAATTLAPGFRLLPMLNGGIPLWVLTLIFIIIDLGAIASGPNKGGALAHIAGALAGFLYARALHRGSDWGTWMHKFSNWFLNLFTPTKQIKAHPLKKHLLLTKNILTNCWIK